MLLPSRHTVAARDVELFDRLLRSFVPPGAFDVHAHLYPLASCGFDFPADRLASDADVGIATYRLTTEAWMGDRSPRRGLFFGIPSSPRVDVTATNGFVAREVARADGSLGLMLVKPGDDPAAVEATLRGGRFAGFKVYHTFAARGDTPNAELAEYLPAWLWELADKHGSIIMLHLVKALALADAGNQRGLRENLSRFRNAKVILAHAARGFCADHTIDGIGALAGFENVFFDTSAICEAGALLAILREFGAGRLMFGTDYPTSSMRGRCVSVADGFVWLSPNTVDWNASAHGQPTLIGIESLLALKQAVKLAGLGDAEVEAIFFRNATNLLAHGR
ncbi:MAG: amidohydrolase family protein [Tepidisphaeraceae bacterium]